MNKISRINLIKRIIMIMLFIITFLIGCVKDLDLSKEIDDIFKDIPDVIEVESLSFNTLINGAEVEWTTDNLDIISKDGLVTKPSKDTYVIIKIKINKSGQEAIGEKKVLVLKEYDEILVNSIIITGKNVMNVDESLSLNAEIKPYDAYNKEVIWSSSDDKVLTVSEGVVKAKSVGTASVICQSTDGSNVRAEHTIEVIASEEYNLISEVFSRNVGDKYNIKGTVVGINTKSILVSDLSGIILVYLGEEWVCDLVLGDFIEVEGTTSFYGGAVQFSSDSKYKKLGKDIIPSNDPVVLNNSLFTSLISEESLQPIYVCFEGYIYNNGEYVDIIIDGISNYGCITSPFNREYYNEIEGKKVKFTGYFTNLSSNLMYINLIPTNISLVEEEDFSISKALYGSIGSTYTSVGVVICINDRGFIIKDDYAMIYIYKGSNWDCDIKVTDVLKVTGKTTTHYNSVQFGNDATYEVIGSEDFSINLNKKIIIDYETSPMEIIYGYIEGILVCNSTYYNLTYDGREYSLNYPSYELNANKFNGMNVRVYGYIASIGNVYVNMIPDHIESIGTVSTDGFELNILAVNDLHGYCEQDEYGKNGISNLAFMIDDVRNEKSLDDVVLIASGDMFQGTGISNVTKGLAIVEMMNAMNFDCMVLGNHEFDWGLPVVLRYFDNDPNNGEANFPLLNSNVYNNNGTIVDVENGNVMRSTIIQKEMVKIGVIGYIGNVYTSISYPMRKDYYFDNDIARSVEKIGRQLKDNGCNVIIVAIHGGNSSGIENYDQNVEISRLMYNDDYLVDAILNGHTHSLQTGYISRSGVNLPLIQSGSNCEALGRIILKIDEDTLDVIDAKVSVRRTYEADSKYNKDVEDVLQNQILKNKEILDEVYSIAGETISYQSSLQPWVGNVMLKGTDADIAICNSGGLRSNGDIVKGAPITISNMYMINPFDNFIMIVNVKGREISSFLNNGAIFYQIDESIGNIQSDKNYKVAVIDYVYYWDNFPQNNNVINSNIILRDLLIEDVKLRNTFSPISDYKARIGNMVK